MKYFNKMLITLSTAALVLTGCGADEGEQTSTDSATTQGRPAELDAESVTEIAELVPQEIRDKGQLDVAITVGMAPLNYAEPESEEMVGLNPDLASLVGDVLDLDVNIHGVTMDQIIPGMEAGRYDVTFANMGITPERAEVLDFVEYYFASANLGVRKGNPADLSSDTLCGVSIGVANGSYQHVSLLPKYTEECEANGEDALDINTFPEQQQALLALSSSRVDAVSLDGAVLLYAISQDDSYEDLGYMDDGANVGIGVLKGNELLEPVQLAMNHLSETELYQETLGSYGIDEFALEEFEVHQ
ncbi:MAG: transporter substrate-binding domain-containing protein [Alteromonadaceae bacterium]|nr:transporter substrate-binding domain-containing protein [Alteromonadaceae bacterium]